MENKKSEQYRISLDELLEMLEDAQYKYSVASNSLPQNKDQIMEKESKMHDVESLVLNLKQTCHYAPIPNKENFLSIHYFERDLSEWIRLIKKEIDGD